MKRILAILSLALLFATAASAQQPVTIDATITTCPGSPTSTGCAIFSVAGQGTISIQLTGTWTGTLSFTGSIDGTNFVALNVTPPNSTSAVTTATANGVFSTSVAGLSVVRVTVTTPGTGSTVATYRTVLSARGGAGSSGGGGGGGGVTSATGTANQVTVSASTGAVTFSTPQDIATSSTPQFARLGLGAAADATSSFLASQSLSANTSTDGLVLTDPTAATAANQRYSPRIRLTGQGWKTTATAASQTVDWLIENQPVQGTANPTTNLVMSSQVNGGGYTARAQLLSTGRMILPSGVNTDYTVAPGVWFGGPNFGGIYGAASYSVRVVFGAADTIDIQSDATVTSLSNTGGFIIGTGYDTVLTRDAADTFAQRRTTNAQAFRLYNTWTNASNYERLGLTWASNIIRLGAASAGTGTARVLTLDYGGTSTAAVSVPITSGDVTVATSGGGVLTGSLKVNGTTFTASGCSNGTLVGGASAGSYASGTTGACTVVVTMGNSQTATNGWACHAANTTTSANLYQQSASTTTTATFTGTTVSGDVVRFACTGY